MMRSWSVVAISRLRASSTVRMRYTCGALDLVNWLGLIHSESSSPKQHDRAHCRAHNSQRDLALACTHNQP